MGSMNMSTLEVRRFDSDANNREYVTFRFLEIDHINSDVTCAPFNPRALDFLVNGTYSKLRGSCNGLLCITQIHLSSGIVAVYVINPLLGEFLKLPLVGLQKIVEDHVVLCGFGCSRYSNKYKVLKVLQNFKTDTVHGEILTVGVDDKWRSFEDASLTMELIQDGFAMNGVVHFLGDDGHYGFILAFDVEEESVHHINLPPRLSEEAPSFNFAVWDDKLCFIDNFYSDTQVDIWTMKEYGVVESWSKEIILTSWVPVELCPYYRLDPITTLRNKDLLVSCENEPDDQLPHLISYNPTVKMFTKHEVAGSGAEDVKSNCFAYVPNVIPLMDNLLGVGSQ